MRNLKKILALVLALMMVVSTMVFASAASLEDYVDGDEVSAEYAEAVEVLTGMGIFKGDEEGFRPQDTITRAEVSTSVYRVLSGDVTDSKVEVWKEYTMFDDVASDAWYAGFVNYAANVKWVIGVGNNKFDPNSDVTGYEMLAILLRALGYDKNQEFANSDDWRIEVATIAEEIGLTDVLVSANPNRAMTREQIAALMFQALQTSKVKYTLAYGYRPTGELLGDELFDLKKVDLTEDAWGRPSYGWSYSTGDKGTYWEYASTLYTTPVAECDVVDETGVTTAATYTNGNEGTVTLSANATKATIGEQGRQTYVYNLPGTMTDRIVYIDTFLALVTDVTTTEVDVNGHLARQALLQLRVYNGVNGQNGQLVYKVSDTDWNYVRGEMLLVNAVTTSAASSAVDVTAETPLGYGNLYNVADHLEIVDKASSFVGAQTYNQWNANTHTINGTVYNDALFYVRDDAGIDRTENFNWWLDQYGNVIGSTAIDRNSYAVLKDLIWIDGTPGYAQATLVNMDGTEYTATVALIDGDGNYVAATVSGFNWGAIDCVPTLSDSFQGNPFNTLTSIAQVSSNSNYNGTYLGYALYQVTTLDNGTVVLTGSTAEGQTDTVINYVANGTLSANASTILANDGSALAHIDDSTRIIVNNGDGTYSAYTRSTLPNLAGRSMEIFYSVVDGAFTQNVYIKRAVAQATFGDHLFTTSSSNYGHATADFADGRQVWEIPVVVDGVSTTIRTINTNIAAALTAQGNQGKLFHVTFDQTPLDTDGSVNETYGFVTDVDLVTEATDGNNCDYLYPYDEIHLGTGTIECDDVSYNVSSATTIVELDGTTVAYNVQTLDEALKNEQLAVWVVESNNPATNVAATVYIGTKLSDNTALVNPTAVVGTGDDAKTYTGTWDTARDTYTITVPHGTTTWTLTASANADYAYILTGTNGGTGDWLNLNGHAKNGTATFEDSTIVWAASNTATYSVTVFAENDAVSKGYTINVVEAPAPNQALNMIDSVTLNNDAHILTVPTSYETAAEAVNNAVKITLTTDAAQSYALTVNTKLVGGTTPAWGAIQGYGDKAAALACDLDASDKSSSLNGTHTFTTVGEGYYIVIMTEVNGDVAYHAYYFGK